MIDLTGLAKKVSYTCGSNEFARKAFKRFCVDENQTNTITLVELASLKSNIVDH